jgi:hypothetical protein
MSNWYNAKTIGECAYCRGEIYEGNEFYASGLNTLVCSKECRDAYIAECSNKIGEDDFIHWEAYEYEVHR